MKPKTSNTRRPRLIALGLAMGAGLMTVVTTSVLAAEAKNDQGFMQKVERWQDKMSDAFRDTWRSLRGDKDGAAVSTASVDLREQQKSYTVRLNLPHRDLEKVAVTLNGDTLRIVAPADDKTGRYEETLALAGVASDAKMKIDRKDKDGMIVITVPKESAGAKAPSTGMAQNGQLAPLSDWDREFLGRMDKMRQEMDRIFNDSFDEFRHVPDHMGYFDAFNFGSSVNLKDDGENYVVTAYLPERNMENVSASVENRTLKIEAKAESSGSETKGNGKSMTTQKAEYLQILTLPGPVKVDKMKVERKEGILTVTLPKA